MGAAGLGSRAIIGEFYHRLSQLTGISWVGLISMLFDSNQESETYKWLGMVPQMREWVGGRQAKGFRENGITIANKKYESTLEVDVDDIRRDKTGQIMVRIGEQARRALSHWAKLLSTLIVNGVGSTNGLCYDGQYFFDSDHSEGDSGTQLNLLTATQVPKLNVGTATAPTIAEMIDAILGVIGYMLTYKDDQGEPMNEDARQFLVMIGTPQLWAPLMGALGQQVIASGVTNVLGTLDGFKIVGEFNPRLSAMTDDMVIFRTDSDVKALIRQEEEAIKVSAIAEGSELEFEDDVHHYGIKALRNVGYGYWQMATHSTFS